MKTGMFTVGAVLCAAGSAIAQPLIGPAEERGDPIRTAYIVHGGASSGTPGAGQLAVVDLNTGIIETLRQTTSRGLTGLAYVHPRLYAATDVGTWFSIGIGGRLIGSIPITGNGFTYDHANGDRINDLTADPAGNIYGTARIANIDRIVSITNDGIVTILANRASPGGFGAIAYAAGVLYVTQAGSSRIDIYQTNGALFASNVIADDGTANGALGFAFDPSTFNFYYSVCCNGTLGDQLRVIDGNTGVTSPLFDFGDDRRIQDIEFVVVNEGDTCFKAFQVPSLPFSGTFDNTLAQSDGDGGTCNSQVSTTLDNSQWFRFTAPGTGYINVFVDELTAFDMIAVVYAGPCSTQTEIACADEPEPINKKVGAIAGQQINVAVGDWGTGDLGGTYNISITYEARYCADQNLDTLITPADFNAWVINYNNGDPRADANQDGILSPADFNAWVIAFNQGAAGPRCN